MPAFVEERKGDAALAEAAWNAAVECTGRIPDVLGPVPITRSLPTDSPMAGLATWGGGVPGTISLWPYASATVLAHEVAHAWIHRGASGHVEGRTELLTECIQQHRRDLFPNPVDRLTELVDLTDITEWQPFQGRGDETGDGYVASFRLFRAMGRAVPPESLWGEDVDTWDEIIAVLRTGEPRSTPILRVLREGANAQRSALRDGDLDGESNLFEEIVGTDPKKWDTDGDGWWDGAPKEHPVGAIPFPRSKHPICIPMIPTDTPELLVDVVTQVGGYTTPEPLAYAIDAGGLLTWQAAWTKMPGGAWARARGDALVTNPHCVNAENAAVRSSDAMASGVLAEVAVGIAEARTAIAAALNRELPFAIITLDAEAEGATVDPLSGIVRLSSRGLATTSGRANAAWTAMAMLAVAPLPSGAHAPAAAAFLRTEFHRPPDGLDTHPWEVDEWVAARKRCARGWSGLLDGWCERPK